MWKNYCMIAWKVLLRRKFFTFASLFGIGFTLMVLMVSVTIAENFNTASGEEEVGVPLLHMKLLTLTGEDSDSTGSIGYRFVRDYILPLKTPEKIAIYRHNSIGTTFHNNAPVRLAFKGTDVNYWDILNFTFLEGRAFNAQEAEEARPVAVITEEVATRLFGDASPVGKDIILNGSGYRILGVVQTVPVTRDVAYADIWVPLMTFGAPEELGDMRGALRAVVKAKDKADIPAIKEEVWAINSRVDFTESEDYTHSWLRAETTFEITARDMLDKRWDDNDSGAGLLLSLMVSGILLFMLLPAINLINLNVSRIMERAVEIGVRKAFGASSKILVGQFVFENLILTALGGLFALITTPITLYLIEKADIVSNASFALNPRIFAYALFMILIFGLISGAYPAWKMARLQPAVSLKGGAA